MIENEVSILRRVDHPNIILLIEEFDTKDSLYLVMEYVKVCIITYRIRHRNVTRLHYQHVITYQHARLQTSTRDYIPTVM